MKKGWEIKKLIELGEIQTGTTPSTRNKEFYGDYIPFVKPPHFVSDGTINYENVGLSEIGLNKGRLIKENSILMVCIGATIGKTGITTIPVSCNQQINAFTPKKELEPRYFYYLLNSSIFFNEVLKLSSQATLPMINKSKWQNIKVSYPKSLPEQQRIVSILDKAFAEIAKAKNNAEQNLKNTKELFESYLQGVFENKGDDWEETSLKNEIDLITGFAFKSKEYTENSDDVFLLRGDNIMQGYLRLENIKYWRKEEFNEYSKYQLKHNDIVLAMDRPWVSAGLKCARITNDNLPSLLVQRTACLRNKSNIDNSFLYYLIKSEYFMKYLIRVQTGIGVPHISGNQILGFSFHMPTINLQKEFTIKLDKLSSETKNLENIYQQKLEDLEELKKSILQKAFNGEL